MIQFKHRQIGSEFVRECEDLIFNGSSAVLLGPRFGGKRYIHEHLVKWLSKTRTPVIYFSIVGGNRPNRLDDIRFTTMIGEVSQTTVGDPSDAVRALNNQTGSTVILLATNIDSLPQEAARAFLRSIRVFVEDRSVATLLSGEVDFRDLVHGVHSEFNCADQFVLQGFHQSIFQGMFEAEFSHIDWQDLSVASERLWQLTKGNLHLMRLLSAVANARRSDSRRGAEITEEVIQSALQTDQLPTAHWTGVLHRPIELVSAEPECSQDLETLLRDGSVQARALDGAPGIFELSGIGIRNRSQIEIASEFMGRLAKHHFTPQRVADLYSQNANWPLAFERYSALKAPPAIRPENTDDRRPIRALLQTLASSMFAAVTTGEKAVCDLLSNGAKYLLGFSEVSFWLYRHTWELMSDRSELSADSARAIARYLPCSFGESKLLPLPDAIGRFALAIFVRGPRDRNMAVVLSALDTKVVLSRERRILAQRLLDAFAKAHEQSLQSAFNADRLQIRDRHVNIFNRIFDFLGGRVWDVRQILELTGNDLLGLGYRRVMFSLVDSKREFISGVLDCPSDLQVSLAQMTHYPLATKKAPDIQQYVIWKAEAVVVEDADIHLLVNPEAAAAALLKNFAVVPILDRNGLAIGTIHIERSDGEVPIQREVQDLELFGRQLARILALNERTTLIQKCLDSSTEPLMIADPRSQIIYANKTTAELFGLSVGWQDVPQQLFRPDDSIHRGIAEALNGHHAVRQVQELGTDKSYRGEAVCDTLKDWRNQVLGVFVDIHDLRSFLKLVEALTKIGPAPDFDTAIEAVLTAFESFGYPQVRMYRIDPASGLQKSYRGRGLSAEQTAQFDGGKIILPSEEEEAELWLSLRTNQTILFYYGQPDDPLRRIKYTDFGLEARAVQESTTFPPEFQRIPGEYWLSIPLQIENNLFGKIIVMCDGKLQPHAFEAMKLLAARTSELLLAQEAQSKLQTREQAVKEGFEKAMAIVAHNLRSRLVSLPLVLARYRLLEQDVPRLLSINDDFQIIAGHIMGTIDRAKELISSVKLRCTCFDLTAAVLSVLQSFLPQSQFSLSAQGIVWVEADLLSIETALVELLENSTQLYNRPYPLQVSVSVTACRNPDRVRIDLRDNGYGIRPEHKNRIFEEFFSNRPGMNRSTGLGLAFVRRTISAHGGIISECGTVGEGAHFVLELPRSQNLGVAQ